MVFKGLLSFWRGRSALQHVFASFNDMLITSKTMFELATDCFTSEQSDLVQTKDNLIKMDTRLNTLQQVIRRDIITHIAVQGTTDIVPCLVMMSIIKDAERTGDYAKNIHEVVEHWPNPREDPLFEFLKETREKVLCLFDQTIQSFEKTDHGLARTTCEGAFPYLKKCDQLVWDLIVDNKGRNAVAAAMIIRFFKRIIAHLENICTSVIMPLDKIDYYEKK